MTPNHLAIFLFAYEWYFSVWKPGVAKYYLDLVFSLYLLYFFCNHLLKVQKKLQNLPHRITSYAFIIIICTTKNAVWFDFRYVRKIKRGNISLHAFKNLTSLSGSRTHQRFHIHYIIAVMCLLAHVIGSFHSI